MNNHKKVLITGASRGLGKELAFVFANNDYDLVLHSKNNPLPVVYRNFRFDRSNTFVKYDSVHGDIQNLKTVDELVKISKEKEIGVFINNAAIYTKGLISDISAERCHEILNVNLISPIFLIKGIWEVFKKRGSGIIININSVAGKSGSSGESIYSASKHGLAGFLKCLQFESVSCNIQIIDVYLGGMKTQMTCSRKDVEKLMSPYEAAKCIYSACLSDDVVTCKTTRISEITINRRIY